MFNAEGKKAGVDIIVLNLNNAGVIEKCVESVKEKTDGLYNLIVVDNGSTDGSREWLKQRVNHLILNEENLGAWEGRNQGVRESRHDLVIFLDSDIEIRDKDWVDKLWGFTVDRKVGIVEARVKNRHNQFQFAGFACCMVRKKVFREIGLFDGKFMIGGDLDFWLRFSWYGKFTLEFCEETNIFHKCGETLNFGSLKDKHEEWNQIYRKEMLETKYTEKIIGGYLNPLNDRRMDEERKRGWRE